MVVEDGARGGAAGAGGAAGVSSEAGTGPSPRVNWSFHVLSNTVSLTDGLEWQEGKLILAQWQIGKENFHNGK